MEKQRWEESERRRAEERRERVRRKKVQARKKVGTSRNTVFFQWFVAPEGPKVGSLKRRVRSHVVIWEMKNCTPLWREGHFPSQNVQNAPGPEHFWKLRCRKSARRCDAKHRCSTSYDLASLCRGRRSTLDRWSGQIAKRNGTGPSALHSTVRFWRKSRRIALFLFGRFRKLRKSRRRQGQN